MEKGTDGGKYGTSLMTMSESILFEMNLNLMIDLTGVLDTTKHIIPILLGFLSGEKCVSPASLVI